MPSIQGEVLLRGIDLGLLQLSEHFLDFTQLSVISVVLRSRGSLVHLFCCSLSLYLSLCLSVFRFC